MVHSIVTTISYLACFYVIFLLCIGMTQVVLHSSLCACRRDLGHSYTAVLSWSQPCLVHLTQSFLWLQSWFRSSYTALRVVAVVIPVVLHSPSCGWSRDLGHSYTAVLSWLQPCLVHLTQSFLWLQSWFRSSYTALRVAAVVIPVVLHGPSCGCHDLALSNIQKPRHTHTMMLFVAAAMTRVTGRLWKQKHV
jgi:hypothetical protein